MDDRGGVHYAAGYDPETGLYHDKSPAFDIPTAPSQDDALRAAEALFIPFSKYAFEDPGVGRALVLGALFTALERPFLPSAPMLVVRSSMAGTGKGLLLRTVSRLAFDTVPIVVTWGGSGEEFEKRLAALLLQAPAALSIDNANGMMVEGDLLESILTEGRADIRPLGRSDTVRVRNRSLITLTGNNPIITGDMARRTLVLDIIPRSADPERDRYEFDPTDMVGRRRTDFLRAAFIIMRAYRLAGMPRRNLPAVGSFDQWSRRVRDLVDWITGYDLAEAFRRNKAEDPKLRDDASLLAALHDHFGATAFKSADAIAVHDRVTGHQRSPYLHPKPTGPEEALHDALDGVLGSRGVNAKLFGYWARRVKGAHIGGFILDTHHDPATNANLMTIRRV
jgi:putative DNA primase/helicase